MKKQKLPKQLFVVRRGPTDSPEDQYYIAVDDASVESIEDGDVVGVYELVETKIKRIEYVLEDA